MGQMSNTIFFIHGVKRIVRKLLCNFINEMDIRIIAADLLLIYLKISICGYLIIVI